MTAMDDAWRRRRLLVIAGGVVMGAALGVRNVQGRFLLPVTLDRGWSRETFGLALALQNLLWGVAPPLTGMISDRFGSAHVIFAGALLYALGLAMMALSASPGIYTFGVGVVLGVALSGTAFGAVYGALSRLFAADQRSWALSVAGMFGGLGQFCVVPLTQGMIGRFGWVAAILVLAAMMLASAPLAAWLRDRPRQPSSAIDAHDTLRRAIGKAFAHRGFWLLNLGFLSCGFQLAFIGAHLPAYLLDKAMSAREASLALALIALANTAGTFLCGYAGGFLRRKYLLSAIYFARAVVMALFLALPLSPFLAPSTMLALLSGAAFCR